MNSILDYDKLAYPIDSDAQDVIESFQSLFKWILPKLSRMDKVVLLDKILLGNDYKMFFSSTSHILADNVGITAMENNYKLTTEDKESLKEYIMAGLKKFNLNGMTILPLSDLDVKNYVNRGWENE